MQMLLKDLEAVVRPEDLATGDAAAEQASGFWNRLGTPIAVVKPRSTEEVSAILRTVHAAGGAVVPWGGKTGLVEGCTADGAVALSLERMNAVEEIDVQGSTMVVQAGCILQTAAERADDAGLFLPLDLGARGSATIGGNISTNAGGNRVLRYGMMREMVLGLEAVLADGTVVSSMNRLIKNNTGYDLKQLFIGSEGTLGVVTRAVLRLRPKPTSQQTGFLAVDSFDALPKLLRFLEAELSGSLSAFEVLWPEFYELVTTEPARGRPVLPRGHAYYVLTETLGAHPEADAERFETVLGEALEQGLVADAAIAKSQAERDRMWGLRDDVGQVARNAPIVTFDVSLPISEMEEYVARLRRDFAAKWEKPTLTVFGHLGDGNLHVIAGVGDKGARHAVEETVYEPLKAFGGSISAEHGIGLQKKDFLNVSRSEVEVAVMRTIKQALDPKNVLNPGKIFG